MCSGAHLDGHPGCMAGTFDAIAVLRSVQYTTLVELPSIAPIADARHGAETRS